MKDSVLRKLINDKEKVYVFCLGVFLFLLPFEVRYNNIGLIFLILGWLFSFNRDQFSQSFNDKNFKALYFLAASFYLYFVIRGIDFSDRGFFYQEALKDIGRKIALILFPLFFNYNYIKQNYKTLLIWLISGIFIAIIICFGNALYVNLMEGLGVGRGLNHFNAWYFSNHLLVKPIKFHPTFFALVTSLIMHLCVLQILPLGNRTIKIFKNKKIASIIAILLFVFILALSSRNVIFFSVLSVLFIVVTYVIQNKNYKILLLFVTIITAIVTIELSVNHVNKKRFMDAINFNKDIETPTFGGSSFRISCAKALYVELAKDNLLFGIGTGRDSEIYNNAYLKYNLVIAAQGNYNAHNQYLETLISNGILGLFLLMALFLYSFWYCYNSRFYFGFMVVYLFATVALTESILVPQKGIWLYISLLFVFVFKKENYFEK